MLLPEYDENFLPEGYIRTDDGLLCKPGYLDLSAEEKKKICNGIGASEGISKYIPSTIWGLDCEEAGNRHDYDYFIGGTKQDKEIADKVFLHNCRTLIKKGSWWLRALRYNRTNKYYLALEAFGKNHFNFTEEK